MEVYLSNMSHNRYYRDKWVLPLMDTIQFYVSRVKDRVKCMFTIRQFHCLTREVDVLKNLFTVDCFAEFFEPS